MNDIIIISNDKVHISNGELSTNNNDTINIIDTIQSKFNIHLYSRKSSKRENFKTNIFKRITFLDLNFLKLKKLKSLKVFIISLTPFNFFIYLSLFFFIKKKNIYLYLRSDGYKEYETKIGFVGYFIYDLMIKILSKSAKIISVSKNIKSPKVDFMLTPSELSIDWLQNSKEIDFNTPKLLYIGRFKKEKGIYSLIDLLNELPDKYQLTIVGNNKQTSIDQKKINLKGQINEINELIKTYDTHNIFILPSFTEGAPKVILECLARKRPVIIFKEITHVISNYKGIFVSERNSDSLKNLIDYILQNYKQIQTSINTNVLHLKKDFQAELLKILDD